MMSLIGDALRKARQQTAPPPALRTPPGSSSRVHDARGSGKTMAIGLVLGALAALAGGAGVWFLMARATVAPRPERVAGRITHPAPVHVQAPREPSQPHNPRRVTAQEKSTVASPPATPSKGAAVPSVAAAKGTSNRFTPAPPLRPSLAAPAASAVRHLRRRPPMRAKPKEVDAVAEARVGSTELSLDYIVYRADNPFAQINGQEVHVGTVVGGYIVKEIQPNYVLLTGTAGEKVKLRVR